MGGHRDRALIEDGVELTADEDDDASFSGVECTLSEHSADVEQRAREYASRLGFPHELVEDIAFAGWLHDIGKADRRFQLWLRGGSEIDLFADERPWAKSLIPSSSRDARRAARRRSGYPDGARHEVQSLAMAEANLPTLAPMAKDLDLVLHLVASSHGFCRPFAPVQRDSQPVKLVLARHHSSTFGDINFGPVPSNHGLYRLDSSIAERFWHLVDRYGWLELCWLEAVLRLADHRASEEEEGRTGRGPP